MLRLEFEKSESESESERVRYSICCVYVLDILIRCSISII